MEQWEEDRRCDGKKKFGLQEGIEEKIGEAKRSRRRVLGKNEPRWGKRGSS